MEDFVTAAFSNIEEGAFVSVGSPYSALQVASPSPYASFFYWDEAFLRKLSAYNVLPPRKAFAPPRQQCRLVGDRDCSVLHADAKLYRMLTLDTVVAGLENCSLIEIRWSAEADRILAESLQVVEAHRPRLALTYIPRQRLGELEEVEDRLARVGYALHSACTDGAYASRLYDMDGACSRDAAPLSLAGRVARARGAHARRRVLSREISLDADQICKPADIFHESNEKLGSFWTRSRATPLLVFLPVAGTYEVQVLIEDFSFDRELGLGRIRHFGDVGGQTRWSDGREHHVVASLHVTDDEACEGCLFVFETPALDVRSFSHGHRSVGVKIKGLTYRLVTPV